MGQEIWKWVPDYEGHYKVSNTGNVLSFKGKNNVNGKSIKPCENNTGYMIINLCKNGNKKNIRLNKIVCEIFNGAPPTENHHANHIDGDKSNNRADNLEWTSPSENNQHAINTGLRDVNQLRKKKPVIQKTLNNEVIAIYPSLYKAAKAIGLIDCSAISLACKKKLKTYKGFIWEYAEVTV